MDIFGPRREARTHRRGRFQGRPCHRRGAVAAFLYKEARFQDEHRYEAWEALWTDDGVYWVPANGADIDPEKEMSIIYDNRSRISLRIKQLLTGKRHTQTPQSRLRRLVSNIELLDQQPGG